MRFALIVVGLILVISLIGWTALSLMGDGALKRMTTIGGVYSVCKPDGYDVVCFLDADSDQGGLSCVPITLAGGVCKK